MQFASEVKEQVIKEIQEVGNITIVSKKHGISPKTASTWMRNFRNCDQVTEAKTMKEMAVKIKDQDLQIRILKELLKKTYQVWNTEEKSF